MIAKLLRTRDVLLCLVLVGLVLAVYWQAWQFGLVGIDDDNYITHNPYVLLGLRNDTVRWAFTAFYDGNWVPMVWLSFMADTQVARLLAAHGVRLGPDNVGVYHLSNVAQHALSTVLLFFALLRVTGSRTRSAFVAAVFAVHPLHVESVAWVTERKDTLSTLFWMLTTLAYVNYAARPGAARYAAILLCFALGLMTKSMLITLPIVLLLMYYWPLGRRVKSSKSEVESAEPGEPRRSLLFPVRYSLFPLFALSGASAVTAYVAQSHAGFVMPYEAYPLGVRVANAFVSYAKYVWLTVVPHNLSVCYPHPGRSLPVWEVLSSAALMIGVTALAIRLARRAPYLFVGWMWFVVTLLPVIGLVQLGDQAMADRYTYIPMIGLLIIAAWGVPEVADRLLAGRARLAPAAGACAAVVALAFAAHTQAGYWRDAETMARRVIEVNPRSRAGYGALGTALEAKGQRSQAIECYRRAIDINPKDISSVINLGNALAITGKVAEAVDCYHQALALNSSDPAARYNLARALVMQGKLKDAARELAAALRSRPAFVEAHVALADVSMLQGRTGIAVRHYSEAARLAPRSADIWFRLAGSLEQQGRIGDAIDGYREAIRLDANRWDAANNLAWILATTTDRRYFDPRQAVRIAEGSSRRIRHTQPELLDTLAVACAAAGDHRAALAWARRGLKAAESTKQTNVAKELRARLRDLQSRCGGRTRAE